MKPAASFSKPRLGVNIDHVATIRQARGGPLRYPDPVYAALEAERGGADSITVHLRQDRRHIQDRDVQLLTETVQTRLNVEIGLEPGLIQWVSGLKPNSVCLVPETPAELTTEGGLAIHQHLDRIIRAVGELKAAGIEVSLFIEPDLKEIEKAKATGADAIEIHTGAYACAMGEVQSKMQSDRIEEAVKAGLACGFKVNAGHGLHYHNVQAIAAIRGFFELNIGHAIVARSIFSGFRQAVQEMKACFD